MAHCWVDAGVARRVCFRLQFGTVDLLMISVRARLRIVHLSTPLPLRALARGGEGSEVGGSSEKAPPTPARIAFAMLADPPRRFAGGRERSARLILKRTHT